ncbi:MAG: aspartate ammonia-lyase [Elusimicrobia bacterium RIFOXYB2_FULL_49_7]|nr:MAG: aspartate ammonia-lyase [Elusimicrobia bacterium RIFOXYB2_FULL_49_7]
MAKENCRTEKDSLGEKQIPLSALYGIHALRAKENFPDTQRFPERWYRAMGAVKLACYQTISAYQDALAMQPSHSSPFSPIPSAHLTALEESAKEMMDGAYFDHFIVPACSGGAGTSINMNVNEILANSALLKLGHPVGEYTLLDPVESANRFQSTNDAVPTALHVAFLWGLNDLEEKVNVLRKEMERLENEHRATLRIAFTEMQEAVPSSYGRLFSAYNEALSRDWWRLSKCRERLKLINLGGGAAGTGLSIPRFFIMEVCRTLQTLTGLPVTRSDNLPDATCHLDAIVESHAILKSHAVTLEKMVSDLRLLASDLSGLKEIRLPQQQMGSSIMPGKVNPVIPEFIISAAHQVYANDVLITSLSAQGTLDLNAYLPIIGTAFLRTLDLLIASDITLAANLLAGLTVDNLSALQRLYHSPSLSTALVPLIGYHEAAKVARWMKENNGSILDANEVLHFLLPEKLSLLLQPDRLLELGFTSASQKGGSSEKK